MSSDIYSATGKLTKVFPTTTFPKSGSKSRRFWIEITSEPNADGKTFTNTLEFELFTRAGSKFDNTTAIDDIIPNSIITVPFAVRGRVWNGSPTKPLNEPKCFLSLLVIGKIEVVKAAAPNVQTPSPATPPVSIAQPDDDDMPF